MRMSAKNEKARCANASGPAGKAYEASLKQLLQSSEDVKFSNERMADCLTCLKGKQARRPFLSSEIGRSASLSGSRYFTTFVDEVVQKSGVRSIQNLSSKGRAANR